MKLILLIILSMPFSASADDGWYKDGKAIEDSLWQKHDGPFKAQLLISDEPETIYKQWNEGPANKVRFVDLKKVKAGMHFEAIIVFSGCKVDKNKKCELTGDWSVKVKDGSTLGEMKGSPIYSGPGPVVDQQLMISTNGLGLAANAKDGGYLIQVTVRDNNGNKNVSLQRSVVVE